MKKPLWDHNMKSGSIRKWADHLHKQVKAAFLKEGTHAQILFLFNDQGLASINPIPPGADITRTHASIKRAVQEHHLYGVIHVGEAWTYFAGPRDHTAFQLLDGEMRVSDLKKEDRSECLYLRMESRDGNCVVYLDKIVRQGDQASLGDYRILHDEDRKWF